MNKNLKRVYGYNKKANDLVLKLLSGLSADERTKDRGSHFKSLDELFAHVVSGNAYFLGMINAEIKNPSIKTFDMEKLSSIQMIELCKEVDAALETLIEQATQEQLQKEIDFYGTMTSLSELLFMGVIHSTHHRGQMSQILDEIGVKHDLIVLS